MPRREFPLDEMKRREVCAILAVGCTRRVAAAYVGCSYSTLWRAAVRDPSFAEQLHRARAQHEIAFLHSIQSAAKKEQHWRAAAWALEHMYPERYARRRGRGLTSAQVRELLNRFAQFVADEVTDEAAQQRIVRRLRRFVATLTTRRRARGAP